MLGMHIIISWSEKMAQVCSCPLLSHAAIPCSEPGCVLDVGPSSSLGLVLVL